MHFSHHSHQSHGQRHGFHMMRRGFRHGGGGWDMEAGGRHGRRRVFDSGELRLVLLKLIQDQPRHGYDLIREIEELTGGEYSPSPGVVYPTLTLLQDMGHIREEDGGSGRKTFAITADGGKFLADHRTQVDALLERLKALGATRERVDAAPVRRAMGNLKAVLMHRLGQGEVKAETLHAVTAIIDDAAQRIERL